MEPYWRKELVDGRSCRPGFEVHCDSGSVRYFAGYACEKCTHKVEKGSVLTPLTQSVKWYRNNKVKCQFCGVRIVKSLMKNPL